MGKTQDKFSKNSSPRSIASAEAKDVGGEQDLSRPLPVAHWSLCGFWSFAPEAVGLL